jgi:hypothetical protein
MKTKLVPASLLVAACLLLGGCNYEFPLTAQPTQKIDPLLLGDWITVEKDGSKPDLMKVRKLDDSTYVIAYNGDLYRAFHSDFAKTPFVSVQDLESGEGKYCYFVWHLSADGTRLSLKGVNTKVIPEDTKDREAMQKVLEQKLLDPALFNEENQFVREKPAKH